MQDYRQHRRDDPAEPWWSEVPDASDPLRHDRARRLSQFRRELAQESRLPRSRGWRERRETAIREWRTYLETGQVPPAE